MRRIALSVLSLLVLACNKEPDEKQAAIHLSVDYDPSFKKGCIVVTANDGQGKELSQEIDVATAELKPPSSLDVAIFRKSDWSRTVNVSVTARELNCEGKQLMEQPLVREFNFLEAGVQKWTGVDLKPFTLDGDGDGYVPTENGGTDCEDTIAAVNPGASEVCDERDNNCKDGVDEGFDKNWYPDGDGDGFGRNESPIVQCAQPTAYVQVKDGRFDCDDGVHQVNPDAMELCNNRDDNCKDGVDEGFTTGPQAKGVTCDENFCTGTYQCNAAGTRTECISPAPVDYYPDMDRDMQGNASASAARVCSYQTPPADHVRENRADCDDADPGTRQGGTEVCDGLDNDCDGEVDEGLSCGGRLRQVPDWALGNATFDYRTVAVDPTDGYPVWVAGMEGVMVMKRSAGAEFERFPNNEQSSSTPCGTHDWYAAWVRPGTNTVFLAGEGGALAEHTGGTSCGRTATVSEFMSAGEYLTGLVGFVGSSPPSVTLYAVSSRGGLFEWSPGTTPTRVRDGGDSYWDLSALDTNRLLAVGDNRASPLQPRVFSITPPYTSAPEGQPVETPMGYEGSLRGVAMSSASLAYAVGDNGLALRWTGGATWARIAPPAAVGTAPFTSVATPGGGSNIAYVVDKNEQGKLYRLTQYGFAVAPSFINTDGQPDNPDRPLYDIAMVSVNNVWNVWMVGDDGRVYHYPQ